MGGKGSGARKRDKFTRRKVEGLLGAVLETDIPARVIGVEQRGGQWGVPGCCPKCHSETDWATTEWEGHCRSCGEDYFRLVGEIRFNIHRQRQPIYYAETTAELE